MKLFFMVAACIGLFGIGQGAAEILSGDSAKALLGWVVVVANSLSVAYLVHVMRKL